ncbi:8218_t:CDS:2 [Funneliformis mosseae]|uniref:8218_t:CDS:1 n=1 Tax=Funneliformis mosseae TaxID=27381 RepID=A0A9N8YPK2_FUNMO|nr:8218_t:CDS:2 [Funneliformis mosseae]
MRQSAFLLNKSPNNKPLSRRDNLRITIGEIVRKSQIGNGQKPSQRYMGTQYKKKRHDIVIYRKLS